MGKEGLIFTNSIDAAVRPTATNRTHRRRSVAQITADMAIKDFDPKQLSLLSVETALLPVVQAIIDDTHFNYPAIPLDVISRGIMRCVGGKKGLTLDGLSQRLRTFNPSRLGKSPR